MAFSTFVSLSMHGEARESQQEAEMLRARVQSAADVQAAAAQAQADAMRHVDFSRMAQY